MESHEKLILQNRAWAQERLKYDKDFFKRHLHVQTPEFLWIGCSDSRVPANEVTGTEPGDIFVHRNIANLVVPTDLNLLSVLQYAVQVLKVKTIIVCGHYGCGGVRAAMTNNEYGLIDKWLRAIKDTYRHNRDELEKIENIDRRTDRLVELSVIEQCNNLAKTSIVQRAWKQEQRPTILGWVYHIENGLLDQVCSMDHTHELDPIYRYLMD
ncbi:carbonic anhydrase [Ohtaekwangia koreensis]|uniref:Carbonic anhydrase n=1 Tax=Ohtaekwangia koreensis TaxID=688867 RepID=A0A1T5KTN2_9BACT|nr:carbonic anhydrase [Ohtaekwangia koreensis]SKC66815.1 carbonic anhydrase [Ohtaekwangia koreensis]